MACQHNLSVKEKQSFWKIKNFPKILLETFLSFQVHLQFQLEKPFFSIYFLTSLSDSIHSVLMYSKSAYLTAVPQQIHLMCSKLPTAPEELWFFSPM